MGKNNFLPKCLFLLKNDFLTMLFLFFFHTKQVGWLGLEKYGKFHTFLFFIFEGFPYIEKSFLLNMYMIAGYQSQSLTILT